MNNETHKVIQYNNLMYKGCEPHWKCIKCGNYYPFHCYTKEEIESIECKNSTDIEIISFKDSEFDG